MRRPSREEQGNRLRTQISTMLNAFVTDSPEGTSTENILVLETIGRPDNFHRAVAAIPDLKWLAEIDLEDIEADSQFFERPKLGAFFFKGLVPEIGTKESREIVAAFSKSGVIDEKNILRDGVSVDDIRAVVPHAFRDQTDKIVGAIDKKKHTPLPGRMYLSLSNRQALQQIKVLFDEWERDGRLEYGAGAWSEIFSQLRSVRFWSIKDRVSDTGILDYWREEVEVKRGTASLVAFEIEFSYEENRASRHRRQRHVEELVAQEGGRVIAACDLNEIRFHAIKVELPVDNIERVLGEDYSALFKDGGILFFRPSPQCTVE
ncbi:MAG TPA: hypothetical protein VJ955_02455, partial [Desulfuromonadales bacterium]|nr:hypothetical protein [Desulfuromonadales bacterium]